MLEKGSQMSLLVGGDKMFMQEHRMTLAPAPKKWLMSKYGRPVVPWEVCIPFDNSSGD